MPDHYKDRDILVPPSVRDALGKKDYILTSSRGDYCLFRGTKSQCEELRDRLSDKPFIKIAIAGKVKQISSRLKVRYLPV
jgi:hypothetical protein